VIDLIDSAPLTHKSRLIHTSKCCVVENNQNWNRLWRKSKMKPVIELVFRNLVQRLVINVLTNSVFKHFYILTVSCKHDYCQTLRLCLGNVLEICL
jgi:hypothetical protein